MRDGAGQAGGRPFTRVLIANRGEIAVRIIRACHETGRTAVAVYSDADTAAMHVRLADAAVRIGPAPAAESYLRIDAILDAARATGADAVHPGYGFLAERAAFARAVTEAGLVFVGPRASAIEALGDKLGARRLARTAGVETVPGTLDPAPVDRPDALPAILADAERIGFPLLVKAAAGGGGRGMRRVERAADLPAALGSASAEATSAFGDGAVYLEREIRPARHVEVQLLGDETGQVVAVGERDCSIQRRHQKLVEESPAPGLTVVERRSLHEAAVRIGSAAGLTNAATAEFLRGPGRLDLLPGGQHAAAGRARRHGAGDRAGPGPGAVRPGRGGAPVRGRPRRGGPGDGADPPRHRGPSHGRGSLAGVLPDAGSHPALGHAVGAGRAGRHRSRGGGSCGPRVRQPDGQDHGRGRGPRGGHRRAFAGPWTRPRWPASRRPCRSIDTWQATRDSPGPSCPPTGSRRAGTDRPSATEWRPGPPRPLPPRPCRRRLADGSAAAGPGSAGATPSTTGWRDAGREEAVDRWPE